MDNKWWSFPPFSQWKQWKKINEDFTSFEHNMNKIFSENLPSSLFPPIFKESKREQNVQKEKKWEYEIFNLHDYVVVQIPVSKQVNLSDINIYHTSSELTIEGIPSFGQSQIISLPSLVQHKKTKAKLKDQLLEISMEKVNDYRLTHIDVRSK